jgi:K+-sensing histidine kinase KdpD
MLPDFRIRQRDYLLEISRAVTQELDLQKLLDRILGISIEMLAGKAGLIALRSEPEGWKVAVENGLNPAFVRIIEPQLAQIPTDSTARYDLPEINRLLTSITRVASQGFLTGVGIPLVARKKIVGVIFIFRDYQSGFSSNDRALLSSFADQAAIAVQNAQLYTQISQEKTRLDAILDSAADGILILGADHHIERCNHAFLSMLNAERNQIMGKSHEEVICWAQKPQGLPLEEAEAGGWPLTQHAQLYVEGDLLKFGNKSSIPVGITYAPLLSDDGILNNIIVSVRDITRFRQADELKSVFISIISHELKTPVALIKGYVSTLRREDATWNRAVVDDSLKVIEEEADHLNDLIENLLDASRLQAGGLAIKRSDVLLSSLATKLAERFQTQTTHHKISVHFPKDFPIVLADERRIQQVISNLISNAIKYSPKGEIRINGQVQVDNVIICVSDEGPGIAPNDVPHIFDRFYRSPETARHTKGAGLGLYLARAIVEAHGGRIWLDQEADKGGRICFSLPRQDDF